MQSDWLVSSFFSLFFLFFLFPFLIRKKAVLSFPPYSGFRFRNLVHVVWFMIMTREEEGKATSVSLPSSAIHPSSHPSIYLVVLVQSISFRLCPCGASRGSVLGGERWTGGRMDKMDR